MTFALLLIIVGCILLAWGADRFVTGAAVVASNLGVPPLVIGIVLVGFATSLPEMIVSAMACWQGNPQMAMGNAIGSNITNVGLAVGIAALFRPLVVKSHLLKREFPILLGVMLVVLLLLLDGVLSRFDGIILIMLFILLTAYMVYLSRTKKYQQDALARETEEVLADKMKTHHAVAWWIFGFVLLIVSSRMLVVGAVTIAKHFGVSDLVIGLTIVALGTSLPEIAAAVAASLKNESDIVIGNVMGSNIFNLLPVLIMPAVISGPKVPPNFLIRDFSVMLVITIVFFIFSMGAQGRGHVNRYEASVLILIYVAYIGYLIAF